MLLCKCRNCKCEGYNCRCCTESGYCSCKNKEECDCLDCYGIKCSICNYCKCCCNCENEFNAILEKKC